MARNLDRARKTFVVLLIVIQVAISAIVWNDPKILWEDGNGVSLLAEAIPQTAALFARLPTWHLPDAPAWPFAVAVLVWTSMTAWLLAGVKPSRSHSGPQPQ